MAIRQEDSDVIVLRIVYDGPPQAGKTTSLRALAEDFDSDVYTPAEIGGRTVFFDWLEYTGGLFEGHRLRCQIVSVPGQATLASRRKRLVEAADAVVLVYDTSAGDLPELRRQLAGLRGTLAPSEPSVGVIVQANKSDLPGAPDVQGWREELAVAEEGVALVETTATEGKGIRETFVLAVRLAVDRVRELLRLGKLEVGSPDAGSGEELLAQLDVSQEERALLEAPQPDSRVLAAQLLGETLREEAQEPALAPQDTGVDDQQPRLPDSNVPGGLIWPPVDGRLVLHAAMSGHLEWQPGTPTAWRATRGSWGFQAPRASIYDHLEAGRRELVSWAGHHSKVEGFLSGQRCVVLADNGRRAWQLWQVVRQETSLRRSIFDPRWALSPVEMAERLHWSARLLSAACTAAAQLPFRLAVTVDTIGGTPEAPKYVGFFPDPEHLSSAQASLETVAPVVLRRELATLLAEALELVGEPLLAALDGHPSQDVPAEASEALMEVARDAGRSA